MATEIKPTASPFIYWRKYSYILARKFRILHDFCCFKLEINVLIYYLPATQGRTSNSVAPSDVGQADYSL